VLVKGPKVLLQEAAPHWTQPVQGPAAGAVRIGVRIRGDQHAKAETMNCRFSHSSLSSGCFSRSPLARRQAPLALVQLKYARQQSRKYHMCGIVNVSQTDGCASLYRGLQNFLSQPRSLMIRSPKRQRHRCQRWSRDGRRVFDIFRIQYLQGWDLLSTLSPISSPRSCICFSAARYHPL
jgi:hypothetical protein